MTVLQLASASASAAAAEGETHAATGISSWAVLLILLPLAGAAVLLVGGRALDKFGHLLAVGLVLYLAEKFFGKNKLRPPGAEPGTLESPPANKEL